MIQLYPLLKIAFINGKLKEHTGQVTHMGEKARKEITLTYAFSVHILNAYIGGVIVCAQR